MLAAIAKLCAILAAPRASGHVRIVVWLEHLLIDKRPEAARSHMESSDGRRQSVARGAPISKSPVSGLLGSQKFDGSWLPT